MTIRSTDTERTNLQAAIDFLGLTPRDLARVAPTFDSVRMVAMRATALDVLGARLGELTKHMRSDDDD